jgi:hypothetical protein
MLKGPSYQLRASSWRRRAGRRKRFRRPCSSRSPCGSIGSALRVKPRRPAQCSAADFRARHNLWPAETKARCNRRLSGSRWPTSVRRGDGPQANCRFKHAVIQDAAYDSRLKSRRQAFHPAPRPRRCASRTPSPKQSPIISPRPVSMISPSNRGAKGRQERKRER